MNTSSPGAVDARQETQGKGIPRRRLAARLGAALESGSVLLTAGAGFGKTTLLEQALREMGTPVAWIGCSDSERAPGTLLMRIVTAIADAVPGASNALAERLAVGPERVDALVATRELAAELSRLLVEPLVVVIDDAEHLDGAEESQRLLSELIRAELPLLRLAIASRRALDLRVAKPRAAGHVAELRGADLVFDSEECAALLAARSGREPPAEQVEAVLEATEGWPLGIALTAGLVERGGGADAATVFESLSSAPDLREYLSEELLDSLDPELRDAAIRSSIVRTVGPEVAVALELPADFAERLERAGVLLRRLDGGRAFAYHPLLREFLLARLRGLDDGRVKRDLHATVAPAVAASGDSIGAIEHWLDAERWTEAVGAIEREGPRLLRTSPELMTSWFERLPPQVRELPTIRTLEGQLEWGDGQHERAVEPLRAAVAGHHKAGDAEREWLARFFLAEALFSAGPFEEVVALSDGWDDPDVPRTNMGPAGVAWYTVLALAGLGRLEEAELLASRLRRDEETAAQFRYLEDLASLMVELAAGGAEDALTGLAATTRELELNDPQGRLAVSLSVTGLVHLDIGEVDAAMGWFKRCELEADRLGLGFVARDAQLQRAAVLARSGDLAAAQHQLERAGKRQGTGWRGVSRHKAEAFVAAARGDGAEARAAAERALTRVKPGLVCFRVWAALDMAIVLARSGSPEVADKAVDEAMGVLDDHFPGESGRYHRARLLATRSWLQHERGERDAARETLRACWEQAGAGAGQVARAHWAELEPVIADALAAETISPGEVLPALADALPGAEALVAFTGHPNPAVRRAALAAALTANHPAVLSELPQLVGDSDPEVAAAATAARERLRRSAPPLRFELLGRFRVSRGGHEIAENSWGRPIDLRLLRFLLVNSGRPVPEDLIFEALWPDLSAESARRSLQVSVSRIRKVLDLEGAERSLVESTERAYRLALGERDVVDAEEFRSAADRALGESGEARAELLELARERWPGEPLPEERYADWAAAYRERLADRYIAVLTGVIDLHEHAGQHAHMVDASRELVDLDPLNEDGHRALMVAYARTGRRGHALRQYLECRRALVEGLGVEPEEATSRLQARILAGEAV